MRTTYLATALILVVLTAGCTGTGSADQAGDTQPSETNSPGENADNVIRYTADGFTPDTITIQQGETVTWISEGPSMWVASDRHPTHTQYAGSTESEHCQDGDPTGAVFDACRSQQEYSFTFTKTGEWSYHNHLRAGHGGTVIVE
jgi:plastocyanin